MCGWIYLDSLPGAGTDGIIFYVCDAGRNSGTVIGVDDAGQLGAGDFSGSLVGGPTLSTGVWYFVAFTRDSSDNINLYWATQSEAALNSTSGTTNNMSVTVDRWGVGGAYAGADRFPGCIQFVKVWQDERTAEQLAAERWILQTHNLGTNVHAGFVIDGVYSSGGIADDRASGANNYLVGYGTITRSDECPPANFIVVPQSQAIALAATAQGITAGTIASGSTLYAATVSQTAVSGTITSTATLYAPLLSYSGYSWGEATPIAEAPNSWSLWQTAPATPISVSGDADWGMAQIAEGTPIYGPVVDLADADTKTLQATLDKYGAGRGGVALYIRGSATSFTQHDGTPTWSLYAGAVEQSWRYVQLRIQVA